jgi:hypothetical protein
MPLQSTPCIVAMFKYDSYQEGIFYGWTKFTLIRKTITFQRIFKIIMLKKLAKQKTSYYIN